MTTVGAYEAKTHLAQLLDRVEREEIITVTKHGRAVARLVPVDRPAGDADGVVAALRQARRGVRRGTDAVRAMIDEDHR
ncbi:MAG TPA: type II toxin-antitoxin system prevent-host-death family antitoxin [Acidimicrobiales bacterium]|jgi:prevent-host-death family protein|nr:type II toxin-antitoxin system prevent-host-death family antitoxin [Acidimicrobiales bacterium]